MDVMENSFADSCKLVHHRNVLQRDRRLTGILHYINPEHLHHILSLSMTHQIVPDRLSSCRSETVEIEKAFREEDKQLNAFFFHDCDAVLMQDRCTVLDFCNWFK